MKKLVGVILTGVLLTAVGCSNTNTANTNDGSAKENISSSAETTVKAQAGEESKNEGSYTHIDQETAKQMMANGRSCNS